MHINAKYSGRKHSRCLFICLAVLLAIYYVTLLYSDITITHHHSFTFLDSLFSGNLKNFYSLSVENQLGGWAAVYYLPVYIVFGLWNLPVWLLCKLNIITQQSSVALLWIKTLVIICSLGCTYFIAKISSKFKNADPFFAVFLFLSSLMVVVPTFAVAQYDVISLLFTLWGMYQYFEEDKISWKTLLLFSVAISLKLFALFPFVFLVLLKEKRIIHIIKNLLAGMLISVLSVFPYLNDVGYQTAVSSFNEGIMDRLLVSGIPGGLGSISIFFVCAGAVYIIAYYVAPKSIEELLHVSAWLGFFFYLSFFLFVNANPYWIILLTPFSIWIAVQNDKHSKIALLLETAMECSIIVLQSLYFYWVYLTDTAFSYLLMKYIPVASDIYGIANFSQFANVLNFGKFLPAVYALFAVTGTALLVINNPWHQMSKNEQKADSKFLLGISWFRLLCIIIYLFLSIAIMYIV